MSIVKSLNGSDIWARRRLEILRATERMGDRAETKEVMHEVSTREVFTTKGPQESGLKSPEHYFRHAVRKAMDLGFLDSTEGDLTITDVGQEVLIDGRDK